MSISTHIVAGDNMYALRRQYVPEEPDQIVSDDNICRGDNTDLYESVGT